jgi:8-oxo-dGTP diphosphatase
VRNALLTITYWLVLRPKAMGVRALVVRVANGGQQEVLLVRHRAGREPWGLPGGGIEHDEPLDVAALREVQEEAGCLARVEHLHGVFSQFKGRFSNHITVFVCATLSEANPPKGDLEIVTAQFFAVNALPKGLDPGSRQRIAECMRGEQGLYGPWYSE